jgi:acetyl esterase/lipase
MPFINVLFGCVQDVLRTIVAAYGGDHASHDPLLSPLHASDELLRALPPVYLVALEMDPLLDDSVEFARRLKQLGCSFKLHIVPGIPHGFLNFKDISDDTARAHALCLFWLAEALERHAPVRGRHAATALATMQAKEEKTSAVEVAPAADEDGDVAQWTIVQPAPAAATTMTLPAAHEMPDLTDSLINSARET